MECEPALYARGRVIWCTRDCVRVGSHDHVLLYSLGARGVLECWR